MVKIYRVEDEANIVAVSLCAEFGGEDDDG